jgi:hypothetical protein
MKKFLILLCFPFLSLAQIKTMDVPFAEYQYDPGTCNGFKHPTGSLIFIPANAFEMEDGGKCTGKIVIKYRELHTRADMLVAGVNMILLRDGKRRMLESMGMFEIRAECNGKPMKLSNGKYIQVRMYCFRDIGKVESFIYDKEKRYWLDAGIPVIDFSFKANENNASDSKLWGSSRVTGPTVQVEDSLGIESNYKSLTGIIGKLPEGYFKGMNVKGMGIYNYDAVLHDSKAVPMVPTFVVNTGDAITYPVYVAYEKKNTLIQYWEDDFKERFVLLPEKGIKIFAVLKDGAVAIMKQAEVDALNIPNLKGKTFKFTLEKQPVKPKDKPAMAEMTRIK